MFIYLMRGYRIPTYRLNYGEVREFEAQGAGEVVPELQQYHRTGGCDTEAVFIRRLAMEMCEWSGKFYCIDSRDALAASMIDHGLLECVD